MSEGIEERGIPPLRNGGGMSGKLRIMVVAFVVLFFLVLVGLMFYKKIKEERAAHQDETEQDAGVKSEVQDTGLKAPPKFVADAAAGRGEASQVDPSADNPDAAAAGDALATPPAAGGAPANGIGLGGEPQQEKSAEQLAEEDKQARRQHAPVLAFSRGGPAAGGGHAAASGPAPAEKSEEDKYQEMMMAALQASAPPAAAPERPAQSSLSGQLSSESYPAATASRDANLSFLVRQGATARCVMRTAFNSQLSGFSSCILSDPLYSADGRFIMAERGSEVTGTYQTGQVKPGVSRAFVLWNQIRTPHGIRVTVDSPATDGMGQSGISGRVNNHFWKRFGSGLLLSLVDDAAAQASGSARDFQATNQSMNQAAAIAVENNVNIPPTIKVKSGAVVNIFVARDLDFSTVYSAGLSEPSARN